MDSLNFIFGLRAVNTSNSEEKPLFPSSVDLNNQQAYTNEFLQIDEYLEEEDICLANLKEQEAHEVIF